MTAFEKGEYDPDPETLHALSRALDFPVEFFTLPEVEWPSAFAVSFRALSTLQAGRREAALARAAIAADFAAWLETRFGLPTPRVPDLRELDPEGAAAALRASLGIGERPVSNIVHLLESLGVRVFSLAQDCTALDAFTLWRDQTPFVFLNMIKTPERSRFDAAHELGHLVLHRHAGPRGRQAEREADAFAAAFLMPKGGVIATAPRVPTIPAIIAGKKQWKTAATAYARRLRDTGMLSDWLYRSVCIEFRTSEPDGLRHHERSQLLAKVWSLLKEDGLGIRDVARQLHVNANELSDLCFGLALASVPGGGSGGSGHPADLRLIRGERG